MTSSEAVAWGVRLLVLVVVVVIGWSEAAYTVEYAGCSEEKYPSGSEYSSEVKSVLNSLTGAAATASASWNSSTGAAHGVFQCSPYCPDCPGCISSCVSQLAASCPNSVWGTVRMSDGCYVRYSNVSLMGVEDKTVVLNKCGGQQLGAGDVGPREAVLVYLVEGTQMYRKGGEGEVNGVAECAAGLTLAQCQDCLEEAITLVNTTCSYAASGDVYLASCYARYSAVVAKQQSTYNPAMAPPTNLYPNTAGYVDAEPSSKNALGTEKTLAIIIGIIAIVGVIVIVFFLLRKYAKDDDGCDHACHHK